MHFKHVHDMAYLNNISVNFQLFEAETQTEVRANVVSLLFIGQSFLGVRLGTFPVNCTIMRLEAQHESFPHYPHSTSDEHYS